SLHSSPEQLPVRFQSSESIRTCAKFVLRRGVSGAVVQPQGARGAVRRKCPCPAGDLNKAEAELPRRVTASGSRPYSVLARRRPHRARRHETVAKLVGDLDQLPIDEKHIEQLLAINGPAILVLQFAHPLAGLDVEDFSRRSIDQGTVKA